jgi:hypothetical protein
MYKMLKNLQVSLLLMFKAIFDLLNLDLLDYHFLVAKQTKKLKNLFYFTERKHKAGFAVIYDYKKFLSKSSNES